MILSLLLILLFLPLALFWSLHLLFTLLALLPTPQIENRKSKIENLMVNILIPAHNEQLLLPALLQSLQTQSPLGQSRIATILVIADHCTDQTAPIARQFKVEVLERTTGPHGKPAALREGIAFLNRKSKIENRKSALLILDADCTCSPNLLEQLALHLDAGHKALQSTYLLTHPSNTKSLTPSLLAFALKNSLRPRGMARLRIPTQLFGTGMCFHPNLIPALHFPDHLTEDLALSHQLLLAHTPPTFVPTAAVYSPMPADRNAQTTQKLRWETGQFQTWKKLPLLFLQLALRLRSLFALLDWSAPPLALALFLWLLLTLTTITLTCLHFIPAVLLLAPALTLLLLTLYILLGSLQLAPPSALLRLALSLPKFLLWKLTLYLRLLTGRRPTTWQKTPRTTDLPAPTREANP